jgi:nitroimidazol reductase NimA-like FMN-containing flavoprotein (pyridoxamine 5'-phosphate oxidase superfamily)
MRTYPLYLNGAFVQSEPAWDVVNPATEEPFARISTIDRAGLAQAIADAHAAFPSWRGLTAKLYFHCARKGKKLDLIRLNPKAAFIIDRPLQLVTGPMACDWGMNYESVMGTGSITIVTDPQERKRGLDIIMAHYGKSSPAYAPESLEQTVAMKFTITVMTGKRKG